MQIIKDEIVRRIDAVLGQLSTALFVGRLQDAYGDKSYLEGFIRCAEVANVLTRDEAHAFRQSVQRVSKGERPPETPFGPGPSGSPSAT